ncbi:RlmE family RNA methyltransferase [Nitrosopumilus adriaticus]|uniref:Ribosomal RNA large subunit methyltransferase E n=1 Tax=Nitrosopumilus adriaticus TaxID=1580092 RepID=A0A0D5C0D2_9ARCH|nr:RlmE family RNA methyltransferase [Nitrosopumilus adriaticus]AJW70181.1 Ribosomal RNA large subunit methyltransferase E [Nitrosopumilus adriaticus]
MKLIDARKDHYRRLAHEQGYRSRAAFKLQELNKSYRIIGPGFYVLDLGCAPGGWTQMAVKLAGNQGKVMGVDLSYVEEIPGAHIIRENIEDEHVIDEVMTYFGRKVNAVVCDLSPQVSGNWSVDHAKQISLNYDCTKIMDKVLAKKGNAVFKVFDGEYSMEFRDYVKKKFSRINLTKPSASRKQSSELYLVCLGFIG